MKRSHRSDQCQLEQRASRDLVSNIINIGYRRDAKAPIFEAFVKPIFNNNAFILANALNPCWCPATSSPGCRAIWVFIFCFHGTALIAQFCYFGARFCAAFTAGFGDYIQINIMKINFVFL